MRKARGSDLGPRLASAAKAVSVHDSPITAFGGGDKFGQLSIKTRSRIGSARKSAGGVGGQQPDDTRSLGQVSLEVAIEIREIDDILDGSFEQSTSGRHFTLTDFL